MSEIIKICRKHGELKIENTYIHKQSGIRSCLICKKAYKTDWPKLNKERIKLSQSKVRERRLKELENGTLKMDCSAHGNIPIDRIRIDARGTRVCRICGNLAKIKSIAKVDPGLKRYKVWLYSDRERVNRYRKKDAPNRRLRQIKSYHRMKVEDPENFKRKEKLKRINGLKYTKELRDSYVKSVLADIRQGGRNSLLRSRLDTKMIPEELIELKRSQLLLKRGIKRVIHKKYSTIKTKDVKGV